MSARLLGAMLLAAVLLAAVPGAARAADAQGRPEVVGLHGEGDTVWQPVDEFRVSWGRDAGALPSQPILVTHYRVYSADEWVVEDAISGDPGAIAHIHIPRPPQLTTYYIVVWFQTPSGDGPPAAIPLLVDDAQPAPPRLTPPAGWLSPAEDAGVAIEPPPAVPISGISGYAVSLSRSGPVAPCAGETLCRQTELDVGANGRSVSFGDLPEGVYTVSVCAVSGSGLRSALATTTLRVDGSRPEVALADPPDGWSPRPVALTAVATDPLSGMAAAGHEGPFTAIAVDGGLPKRTLGSTAATIVSGNGVHTVALWGRDAEGNSGEPGISLAPPATATVRIDGTAPAVGFARAQDPADPELIEATVADSLSGPDPARGSIAVRAAGGDRAFQPLATSVSAGHLSARWSSDDYPRGRYEFRATGFDRAGNSTAAVTRADGSAMVLPAPLKAPVALEFGFGGRKLVWQRCARRDGGRRCHRQVLESFSGRPAARTLPAGHGAIVGGRLLSAAGSPLRGRAVTVIETFDHGARFRSRRTVLHSRADGSFLTRLGAGPSRHVSVSFAGDRLLARQSGRALRLAVRTGVGLRVSTSRADIGGAPVVFSGRIAHPGAPIPHAGLPVELEFRLPGQPWEEFRTLQTDASGHFRFPYSFTDDDSAGVRFLFRAVTPPSGGWPFLPGTSRPLPVTGG
jgi:hypothetical protein